MYNQINSLKKRVHYSHYRLRTLGSISSANKLMSSNMRYQNSANITESPHIARLHRYTPNRLQSKVEI